MSDYEKDDELRRKYGEVMDSIADDIRQINVNKSEKIVLDEKADDISENTEDILSGFECQEFWSRMMNLIFLRIILIL